MRFLTFGTKKTNKGNFKEFLAKLSKGLMLPIAMLPMAGLFLGVGATISSQASNQGMIGLATFGNLLKFAGDVIFGALPLLFAIAVAIAFTKDAGAAGLSALVGFLVFSGLQMALLEKVTNSDGLVGYNLLFYTNGTLGKLSDGFGLPGALVGTVLGITQLQTSVFGGLIIGFLVAFLYNKFKDIQLPAVLGFFNGVRFIPVVTFAAVFPLAIIIMIIWPLIGMGLTYFGNALGSNLVGFNSFIFGYVERALVPFGLHHAFYVPLWQSSVGGSLNLLDTAIVNGNLVDMDGNGIADTWSVVAASFGGNVSNQVIGGDQSIWSYVNSNFAGREVVILAGNDYGSLGKTTIQFSDFTTTVYNEHAARLFQPASLGGGTNIGQYMQGKFSFMIFGLPAAAAAMIMAAPKENRKASISVLAAAGFTSLLTGITEPIEFTFLFLAPWLFWGFHAVMAALSFGLMNWIGLIFPDLAPHIGMTFSGGLLDWVIFGAVQENGGSNSWWSIVFGLGFAPIYYFFFYWAIKRFDIGTPGRGGNTKLFTKKDYLDRKEGQIQLSGNLGNIDMHSVEIIKAYGGLKNIKNVDACITKLRIEVDDQSKVNENLLKNELGALGTIKPSKRSVYAIYGVKSDFYKIKILDIIDRIKQNPSIENQLFNNTKNNQEAKPLVVTSQFKEINKFNEQIKIYAPIDGDVIGIEKVNDETFSKKMIGDGVAIIPNGTIFSSVVNGTISSVFHTGHAYTFQTSDQSEILVHIGIDATTLVTSTKLFKPLSKVDQKVKVGDSIASISVELLSNKNKSITPIVILNETLNGRKIKVIAKGKVKKGDLLFIVE